MTKEEKAVDNFDDFPMLVSLTDAAKVIGLSYSYLYSAINEDHLSAYRFGKRWKIKKDDLLSFISESKIPGRFVKLEDFSEETNQEKEGENNNGS